MLEYIDDYDYLMVYQIISEMQSPERVVKSANQNEKKRLHFKTRLAKASTSKQNAQYGMLLLFLFY